MTNPNQLKILNDINKHTIKQIFAHHPNCDLYNNHVFQLSDWRFCIGCTGLYSGLIFAFILEMFHVNNFPSNIFRFGIGILFFLPAVVQLYYKSKIKIIKLLMRFSLGISSFYLATFALYEKVMILKIIYILIFILSVYIYSKLQAKKQLIECIDCKYGEEYSTCKIRYDYILKIQDIESVKDQLNNDVKKIIDLYIINNK